MKRTLPEDPSSGATDDLLPEYELDYRKAWPNRFGAHPVANGRMIILEPDVTAVFKTSDTVNSVLRALIQAMPASAH